ncbi:hypothetical protein FGB62_201g09 [Gracilaria domingensis]|nr:hypothetical protein FGB62_201g09 [Gracilaria domingensis]
MEKRTLEQQVISQAGFTTDAIKRARGLLDADNSGYESIAGEGFTLSENVEKPGRDRNGFRSSSDPSHEKKQQCKPENGRNGSIYEKGERPKVDIQSSCGPFTGFGGGKVVETVPQQGKWEGDEREEMALKVAEKERRDVEAEFKDQPIANQLDLSKRTDVRPNDSENLIKLLDTLTSIQRYALRAFERLNSAKSFNYVDCPFAMPPATSIQEIESAFEGNPYREDKKTSDSESPGEDDTETLLYEIDVTAEGQTSYLKALTDADADMNLYLPLRDGGLEELKFSTVVHGTAAAGLECAQDATFFPHAYNRMSLTMHATRRQKIFNALSRMGFERRRVSSSVSNQSSSPKVYSADTCRKEVRRSSHLERMKTSKGKCDISRYPAPNVHSKKTGVDPGPKCRSNLDVTSSGTGPESQAGMGGLFKNKPKKNARRFTIPGMKA